MPALLTASRNGPSAPSTVSTAPATAAGSVTSAGAGGSAPCRVASIGGHGAGKVAAGQIDAADVGAGFSESDGDLPADAGAGAGDQGDAVDRDETRAGP